MTHRFLMNGSIAFKGTGFYDTIIDLNEVDIRIYLPEKSDIHRGHKAMVNIAFGGRYIHMSTSFILVCHMSTGIEVNKCFGI